jgi:C4-dicarboxylate-specific signal transduction histidine kinase
MIEITGRRIEKIVKSMRSFAHGGETELLQVHGVQDIVNASVDLVYQRFIDHGIELKVMPMDAKLVCECRPTQVMQILVNLLNNAHDAVLKLDQRWASLEVFEQSEQVHFVVTDSGKGIAADVVDKLFNPFFTTKDASYGTGLGLSISKSLAQKHKGTLRYDHSSGQTRFILSLPKKQLR